MKIRDKSPEELVAQDNDVWAKHNKDRLYPEEEMEATAYMGLLRSNRRDRERGYQEPIRDFLQSIPLPPEGESAEVEQLRQRVLYTADAERARVVTEEVFPSGTFMFHGAETATMVNILRSGSLMNARALPDDAYSGNGGNEGISWSLGDIDAIPGSRFHLAGFMAAPEKVLGERHQLAIPNDAAPYEVVQLSRGIDAHDFYRKYAQVEQLYLERNTVMNQIGELDGEARSRLQARAAELDGQAWAIIDNLQRDNLTPENDVRVPVEQLYMVVPEKDLDDWLRVLARCPYKPAGIVAYNGDTVRLEDFMSYHRGDGDKLAEQLRSVVPEAPETIPYADLLGHKFRNEMYDKTGHMIAPEYLMNTKTMTMKNGALVVD